MASFYSKYLVVSDLYAALRLFFIKVMILCIGISVNAQDSAHHVSKKQNSVSDTIKTAHPVKKIVGNMVAPDRKRIDYFRDTIHRERRKFDSTLFTNSKIESTSDYSEELGRVYQKLSKIPGILNSFVRLQSIHTFMDEGDTAIYILKERMYQSDRGFNVRNLEMFNSLLDKLDKNTGHYARYLEQYDTALDGIKKEIADFQTDSLMLHIFRDTALKNDFQPQLQQLKVKWRQVDSLLTENGKEINTLKSQASAHAISIGELLYQVDAELKAIGSQAFKKERHYLWEGNTPREVFTENNFNQSIKSELQLSGIYFSYTGNSWLWLPFLALVFWWWVSWNFRSLRRLNRLDAIADFNFRYINSQPLGEACIFILSIAPLFDVHAPVLYVESIQFLLIVCLTVVFRKRLSQTLLYGWFVFIFLFLLLFLIRISSLPLNAQRWAQFIVDGVAAAFGFYALYREWNKSSKWIGAAISFYALFNLLAMLTNLFGRVTLSQILTFTAAFSFAQTISLIVFVKIVEESFLLQIQASRLRKGYPKQFDYGKISKSIRRFSMIVAVPLWIIVFLTNMNLFDALNDWLTDVFTDTRTIGSFSFTLRGIVLFLGIIWMANFLQKYIAYFFGDTGEDTQFDKGQRSRLMVTRLILLVAGFLLAVAASGLPVDRITVVLGALGVGIGLGLQSIVNNFVSGIILIFDRPLRIGDTVEIGDKIGRVKVIGIRTSTLLTEEGAEVIIPNGDVLSHNIINWTLNNNHVREAISFKIEKPENQDLIDIEAIKALVKENKNVAVDRAPDITINIINTKTVELRVFFWTKVYSQSANTANDIRNAIYHHLESKGLVFI